MDAHPRIFQQILAIAHDNATGIKTNETSVELAEPSHIHLVTLFTCLSSTAPAQQPEGGGRLPRESVKLPAGVTAVAAKSSTLTTGLMRWLTEVRETGLNAYLSQV